MRERENSATGHIGFLEFINAAALPFARNPCNIDDEPIFMVSLTPKRYWCPFGHLSLRDRARERLPWPPRAERDRPFAWDRRSIIDFRGDSLFS